MTFAEIKFDAARIARRMQASGLIKVQTRPVKVVDTHNAAEKARAKRGRQVEKTSAQRAARNKRLAYGAFRILKDGKAHTLRQISERIKQNLQQTLSVVRWMEDNGRAHSLRMFEQLWVARTGVEIPVGEITKDALKKRAERSRKRRHVAAEAKARTSEIIKAMPMGRARPDVGFEALEVWREPQ